MFWNKKKVEPNFIVVSCVNNCLREKCPKWVILYHNITDDKGKTTQKQEGKCAISWIPSILIELKEAINATIKK